MLDPAAFVELLKQRDFGPYVGVPCSLLAPIIDYVVERDEHEYLAVNNEGEAVALASGASLAGRRPVVLLQNSGLGNTVNVLTSLNQVFEIPVLLIVSWRGEPGTKDEPQHRLMGRITPATLDLMQVAHAVLPERDEEIAGALATAVTHMAATRLPYAFVIRKGVLGPYLPPASNGGDASPSTEKRVLRHAASSDAPLRREALAAVLECVSPDAVVVATTGKTARELAVSSDRATNLSLVGSMGCAASIGLGIALEQPHRGVVVVDGDGAALMRLEALVSVGHYRPENYTHVLLDNGCYDSTGAQPTLSSSVDFVKLAQACGYLTAASVTTTGQLRERLRATLKDCGPHFVRVVIRPGSEPDLPRPSVSPVAAVARLEKAIRNPS
jgi:phosphonopyruvate decarboxylase